MLGNKIIDVKARQRDIDDKAIASVKSMFPIKGSKHIIEVKNVWVDDNKGESDFADQKKTKLGGGTWGVPLYAHIVLKDAKTGAKIDEAKKKKLMSIPVITPRLSYIVKGNEYQTINQLRLKPGAYNLRKANDALETQFNLAKGANFKIKYNEDTGIFRLGIGTYHIYLYPLLIDLGVPDSLIKQKWGQKIYDLNKNKSMSTADNAIINLASKLSRKTISNKKDAREFLDKYYKGTDIGGRGVTPNDMLDASIALVGISRGERKQDDRDSLESKTINAVEDFVGERLGKSNREIERNIRRSLDKKNKISDILSLDTFNNPLETLFTNTSLASTTNQINPVDMMSRALDITLMGEGGLADTQMVSSGARDLHPSHLGFIDPIFTPESHKAGVSLQMSLGSGKRGKEITTNVADINTGKIVVLTPTEVKSKYIVFPDEIKRDANGKALYKNGKVQYKRSRPRVMFNGKIKRVDPSKIQYSFPTHASLLSPINVYAPIINTNNGSRIEMLDRHVSQAVSLKNRDKQLVVSTLPNGDKPANVIGSSFNIKADESGIVTRVDKDFIEVKNVFGKRKKYQLHNDFPLNGKSYITNYPLVKPGDKVRKNQVLTDNNFTRDGSLALGKNLTVAIIPFKGHSFDDSSVISESAAKKMTSLHMHKETLMVGDDTLLSKKKFLAYYPGEMTMEQADKLDDEGIIKKGQIVKKGDYIVVSLVKNDVNSQRRLKMLSSGLAKEYRSHSIQWDYDFEGEVTDIVKKPKYITAYIKTEEPMTIGDKFSGLHGNKGTVGIIVPDNEMPRTMDGKPIDMLLNPTTVPSRMNPGQVYELVAGKIAEKTGKPYEFKNFEVDNVYEKIKADAKAAGVSDVEDIYDPVSGLNLKGVMVGKSHMIKLDHPIRKKFQARSFGSGYTSEETPGRGGKNSGQSMDVMATKALLSHGAKNFLYDTHAIKGHRNDEYWRAVQTGQPTPRPKTPFVFNKFVGMLNGAGINVNADGNYVQLSPMSDKEILKNSNGEIKNVTILRGKDMQEEKGGLFDPNITGGMNGTKQGHIALPEEMPNPVFENSIISILRFGNGDYVNKVKFNSIVNGKTFIDSNGNEVNNPDDGITGGPAIKRLLKLISRDKRLDELEKKLIPNAKKTKLDRYLKEYRYLKALKRTNKMPEDLTIKNIPVIPPVYRPIYSLPDGSTTSSSINYLYKDVKLVADQLKESKGLEEHKSGLRKDMYRATKALFGYGESITNPDLKGIVAEIKGDSPKTGLFQSKLVKRRQDLSGRSVISPDPNMPTDNIGLPEKMAWQIYKPFIIKELVSMGRTPLEARDMIDSKDDLARSALEKVIKNRPAILNRAPSLHRYSVMAFKPKIVSGKAIQIPALPTGGFNADFDGDKQNSAILTNLTKCAILSLTERFGEHYVKERIMTARFKETLPMLNEDGEILFFDLEDFPHEDLIKRKDGEKGPIEFFHAMEGCKVLAYDEKENKMVWADVFGWSKHYQREVEIVNLRSKRQIITDDDPRAVYGVERGSLKLTRNTPTNAMNANMLVPMGAKIESIPFIEDGDHSDFMKGYILGCVVSNGWVEHWKGNRTGRVLIAKSDGEIGRRFLKYAKKIYKYKGEDLTYQRLGDEGGWGACRKWGFNDHRAAEEIEKEVGHGAGNKHLPVFVNKSKKYCEGLFAGLMDNDGSITLQKSNVKKKKNLYAAYTSKSLRLVREMQILAKMLGVKSRITATNTPKGDEFWCLSFSTIDIKRWGGEGLASLKKKSCLKEFNPEDSILSMSKGDIVPISFDLASYIMKSVRCPRTASKEHRSFYVTINKARKNGYMSRGLANRIINEWMPTIEDFNHEDLDTWKAIVNNTDVTWDPVVSIEKTGIKEDGYDLTVPGYETFMNVDGVVLSNTMAVHIPVSSAAVEDAWKMLPSNHLRNIGTGKLMLVPSMEAALGLNLITKPGKKTNKKFSTFADARRAAKNKEINVTDFITIGGKKTTLGRAMVDAILPAELRDSNRVITKGKLKEILNSVAENHKSDYTKIADALKELGNKHSFYSAFTIKLDDLKPIKKEKDEIIKKLVNAIDAIDKNKKLSNVDKYNMKVKALTMAQKDVENALDKKYKNSDNAFYVMMQSGAKGNMSQVRSILASPMVKSNVRGKLIPEPVTRSYAEGLSMSDLFIDSFGSRKGIVDKSHETSFPGMMSKMMSGSTEGYIVTVPDCFTKDGINMSVDDKSITDRLSAESVGGIIKRNEPVTTRVVSKLKKAKIKTLKVRSPLKCKAAKGVCVKCAGLDENKRLHKIGDAIGLISTHALSEPMTQMTMRCSAGVILTPKGIMKMSDYFNTCSNVIESGGVETANPSLNVIDKGCEVEAYSAQRHMPHDDLLVIETENGSCIMVQGNHPLWVKGESSDECVERIASDIRFGDKIWADYTSNSELRKRALEELSKEGPVVRSNDFEDIAIILHYANIAGIKSSVSVSTDGNMLFSIRVDASEKANHIESGFVSGYDSVCKITPVSRSRYSGLVYDVKTETKGFMSGTLRNHNTFHTGGGTEGKESIVGAIDRMNQILTMPENLPSKATISTVDGKVTKVEKSPLGGWNVWVNDNRHHVSSQVSVSVKKGDKIKKGEKLSTGVIKPQELFEVKGMDHVRNYLTDEIHQIYGKDPGVRKTLIENMVKAITNLTKVIDPGKTGYMIGDVTSFSSLEHINSKLKKEDRAIHEPIIKGTLTGPVSITAHQDADWMGAMGYRYLKKTISEAASQGWKSDIHGTHPVPALAYSAEFGKTDKGYY